MTPVAVFSGDEPGGRIYSNTHHNIMTTDNKCAHKTTVYIIRGSTVYSIIVCSFVMWGHWGSLRLALMAPHNKSAHKTTINSIMGTTVYNFHSDNISQKPEKLAVQNYFTGCNMYYSQWCGVCTVY